MEPGITPYPLGPLGQYGRSLAGRGCNDLDDVFAVLEECRVGRDPLDSRMPSEQGGAGTNGCFGEEKLRDSG